MSAAPPPSSSGTSGPSEGGPVQNTDRHLWPQTSEDAYAPSLFVTADGEGIGINVAGSVYVKTLREWHRLAGGPISILDHAQRPSNCDCGFSAEVCKTNPCMRKKMATSGLNPDAKYPYCAAQPQPEPLGYDCVRETVSDGKMSWCVVHVVPTQLTILQDCGKGVDGMWAADAALKKLKASSLSSTDRNWVEDAPHENGNYQCLCCECGEMFIGHKRRVLCKICSDLLTPSVTSTQEKSP